LAALEEGNRNRQAQLSAYAELDNIADEDEQEPPGMNFIRRFIYNYIFNKCALNCILKVYKLILCVVFFWII
jgi:hypothetical protein